MIRTGNGSAPMRAFTSIAESTGDSWTSLREAMRSPGRYHVETY